MISSRTPGGEANHCPVCGAAVCVEPTWPSGDAPCPNCGTLLWFWNSTDGVWFYRKDEVTRVRERIISTLCANLEVRREHFRPDLSLREIGPDSLDTVELAMELEEEFEVTIPDDESEKIRTRGDLVDCLLRRRL